MNTNNKYYNELPNEENGMEYPAYMDSSDMYAQAECKRPKRETVVKKTESLPVAAKNDEWPF